LREFGLPTPNGVLSSPDRALQDANALGYPLVLKAVSAQLPHKTEAGAVALNLKDDAALSAALEKCARALPRTHPAWRSIRCCWSHGQPPLAELIVGIKRETTSAWRW
jgi:acyl-CoA synthetase (NDP forming)